MPAQGAAVARPRTPCLSSLRVNPRWIFVPAAASLQLPICSSAPAPAHPSKPGHGPMGRWGTAEMLWQAGRSTGDCHDAMADERFEDDRQPRLEPAFRATCPHHRMILVLDNASDHRGCDPEIRVLGTNTDAHHVELLRKYEATSIMVLVQAERIGSRFHEVRCSSSGCRIDSLPSLFFCWRYELKHERIQRFSSVLCSRSAKSGEGDSNRYNSHCTSKVAL